MYNKAVMIAILKMQAPEQDLLALCHAVITPVPGLFIWERGRLGGGEKCTEYQLNLELIIAYGM